MSESLPLVWTLSGFADEIAPDFPTQLDVLEKLGIRHLELRSIDGTNVLDLTDEQVDDARRQLADRGIAVSAIGSPLGKTPIDEPFEATEARLGRALDLARAFRAPFVRVFSFYPVDGPEAAFPEAVERLRRMAADAERAGIVMAHENEKAIVGETDDRCLRLLEAVASPSLRAVFDPANFVQAGVKPYPDAFERLRPWIAYLHVKDARFVSGEVTPAGEGDADFGGLLDALARTRFSGFLSLEPHLADGGPGGGPEAFRRAAEALRGLVERVPDVELR